MARLMVVQQQTQPSFSILTSSVSDFNGTRLHSQIQYKRKVWQPKGALQVTASSEKKILIMGGTRFIGVFLSRLLVKEGHQVTLFTRGKAPITQQLPSESDQDYAEFSSKILHLKGDRKDFDFVKSSLSAEGFDVVYDINGREADEVEPILDALPKLERYIYCSSAGVYLKSDLLPHFEIDAVDPKSRHKGKLNTEAVLESRDVNWTSIRPVYIYGPLNYNPVEEWFFHRLKAGCPIPIPNSGVQITQLGHVKASSFTRTNAQISQQFSGEADQNYADFDSKTEDFAVPRRNAMVMILSSYIFSDLSSYASAFAQPSVGFREYIDTFDGYSLKYPQNWIQVRGAGADIFFRDPYVLDENVSVDVSSPSSSRYKSVEDLGPPQEAGKKVLKQYLTEFMSTRLGVKRESNVLSTSSRVADDGRLYYQVEVNIKSYANNNELAVMPKDRVVGLEWDRRYLSVLGVENNRLYELRLQTPENVFEEEESDLRKVIDSFRVNKVSA